MVIMLMMKGRTRVCVGPRRMVLGMWFHFTSFQLRMYSWQKCLRMALFHHTCCVSCRKIMDSGELDFYQHTKLCSNTCRSTKIDLVGTKVSISCDQSAELVPATPSSADCKFHSPSLCTNSFCSQCYIWNWYVCWYMVQHVVKTERVCRPPKH